MDYSHAFYAGAQPFHQQFMNIPPLTPSHSNSASDDYNTTSPPEVFPDFPNEHFQNFEGYAAQFAPQHTVFPGPPTPPDQQHLPTSIIPPQPPSQSQPQQHPPQQPPTVSAAAAASTTAPIVVTPAIALDPHHPADIVSYTKTEPGIDDFTAQAQQQEQSRRGGSNSDDDELTPAQSRRKAQNRAAQRAFRERKERHVKDLEAKLALLEAAQQKTATENEQLRQDLQKVSTENEILRATSSLQAAAITANGGGSMNGDPTASRNGPMTTGPMTYNPTDFYTDLLANHDNKSPSHRIATSAAGERLLAAGATWDFIISHELYKRGLVDVADISNRLKHQAKCDGQGPVFEERAIRAAIEQSVGSGSDSLL